MGSTPGADAPTRELATAPVAGSEDRCTNCGAPLAHDQRYCIQCGERRGQSRLPTAPPTTVVETRRTRSSRPPRGQRVSSGTTLVAGVGVLLLAIGLGVLIGRLGHTDNQKAASAPPAQVITVNGGGGSASTTPTTQTKTSAASSTPKGLTGKLKKAAAQTAPPSAAVQKKATQAAGKVLGNSSHLAAPTASQGGSCSGGAGCQNHKFTGNFFGN